MSGHNKERKEKLQPRRIMKAINELESLDKEIVTATRTTVLFFHKGEIVNFFPYSGWHTGKSIKDGRGLENLLKQLR